MAGRPRTCLAASLALTLLLGSRLVGTGAGELGLPVEIAVDKTFPSPESSAVRRDYDRFRATFGNDEVVVAALIDDDLFTAPGLARIERLTRRLERVDGVRRVDSLASTAVIRARDGEVVALPVLDPVPEDEPARERVRRYVLDDPLLAGNLVARDGGAVAFVVHPERMSEGEFRRRAIDREIERLVREESGGGEHALSGVLPLKAATGRLLLRDLLSFVPLSVLAMALVCCLSFRTVRGVAVPLAAVGAAQICTLGVVVASGYALNLVTFIVPPLVMAIGLAYTLHVVAEHDAVLAEGQTGTAAVQASLQRVAGPVALTALTTAAGLGSLLASPLPVIREFGAMSALGVGLALLAALVLAPSLLALLPAPAARRPARGPLRTLAERLARVDVARHRLILVLGATLCAGAALGVTRLETSTSFLDNLRASDPTRRSIERFSRHLDGTATLDVVLDTGTTNGFRRPRALRAMADLQSWLEQQPEIDGATSLTDYLAAVNSAFADGDPEARTVPESRALVAQLFAFLGHQDVERFVDRRYRQATVLVRLPHSHDSRTYRALIERIEARLAELPAGLTGHVTGTTAMITRTVDDIARGQAWSLCAALVAIYAILALYLRSPRAGFVALIPNAVPVLVYFGTLGLTGVTLNVVTSLIACIILGIAVDDTVHLLARYREELRSNADRADAIRAALGAVIRPVTSTTLALCLGFLVLATSGLRHQIEFGYLAAAMLAIAWVVDVTFTPALAYRALAAPAPRSPPASPDRAR